MFKYHLHGVSPMERGEGSIKERMNLLAQEAEKRKRLATLRSDTLRKIQFLRAKVTIDPHEVYTLIKGFFQEFLEQKYEFTIAELRTKLKSIYISTTTREALGAIFDRMHALEYADVQYPREELIKVLDAFAEVVRQLIRTHSQRKSLFARLRDLIFPGQPEPAVIIAELPAITDNSPRHVRIATLVEKCYIALDRHNLRRAKAAYHALIEEYEQLDRHGKEAHYYLIEQTYQDILNRSKM